MANEEVAAKAAHADKTTQADRIAQIERWMAERRPHAYMYQQADKLWQIGDRQVRNLIKKVHLRRQKESATQRPFEREDLAATMQLVIAEAITRGDLETARKATRDLMQFAGFLGPDQGPAGMPLPVGAPGATVNIGQMLVDMRSLTPIERQKRLGELEEKRRAAGISVVTSTAPAPQKQLDTLDAPGAGEMDGERDAHGLRMPARASVSSNDADDAGDSDLDDPKWFAE